MEYKVKKNNNATAELKITFSNSDIEKGFKKAYEIARTKVKINGFRQGKAPLEMVEKILGDSVTEDAVNIILQDGMTEIIGTIEPAPIRVPHFKIDEFNRKKNLIVSSTYFTPSEVILNKYKKMKIEERKIKITDEDISEDLKNIQERMMKTQLKEENELSEKNDMVEFDYSFEPNPNKEKFPLRAKYRLGSNENSEDFDSHLTGLKAGQSLEFTISPRAKKDDEDTTEPFEVKYSINVLDVFKVIVPELNDELAMEWDETPTLFELKEKLKKHIEEIVRNNMKSKYIQELLDKVIEESKFTIPKILIQEVADENFHNMLHYVDLPHISMKEYSEKIGKLYEEVREGFETRAEKILKGMVSLLKISSEEKIHVDDEDLISWAREESKYDQTPEELLNKIKKDKRIENIRKNLLFKKVENYLYDISEKKQGKEITFSEFKNLVKKAEQGESNL